MFISLYTLVFYSSGFTCLQSPIEFSYQSQKRAQSDCSQLHVLNVLENAGERRHFLKICIKWTNKLKALICICFLFLFFLCSFLLFLAVKQLQWDHDYLGNWIKSLLFSDQTHSLLRWAQATRQLNCRVCLQPVFSESSAQLLGCCFSRVAAWFKRWSER